MNAATRVIGIGNANRGDDAAGLLVARALEGRVPASVEIRECSGEVSSLIDAWRGASSVVVVDAMASGLPPGTVHVLAPDADVLQAAGAHWSNHGLGLAEAIELGRALDSLPAHLVVLGIEGEDFETGAAVSPTVARAVERAADLILDTL